MFWRFVCKVLINQIVAKTCWARIWIIFSNLSQCHHARVARRAQHLWCSLMWEERTSGQQTTGLYAARTLPRFWGSDNVRQTTGWINLSDIWILYGDTMVALAWGPQALLLREGNVDRGRAARQWSHLFFIRRNVRILSSQLDCISLALRSPLL